jgi:hypothetical protein
MSCIHKNKVKSNNQPTATFACYTPCESGLTERVQPPKISLDTKFHGPMLPSEIFASTSEVRMSTILKWLKLRD